MERIDRAEIVIPVPRARVWAALTEPDQMVRWLPPAGMTARMERFDLREGGSYRMVLRYDGPHGGSGKSSQDEDVVEVAFSTIRPPAELVQAAVFESDDPDFAGTMTMRWTLDEVPGGTRVAIACHDVPPGISPESHAVGLKSSLDNLAALVA